MAYKASTFETLQVRLFLAKQFPYAAQCFGQEHLSERVSATVVEKWFKSYFPAEKAYSLYRQLECAGTDFKINL
jgi:hypothetical protein